MSFDREKSETDKASDEDLKTADSVSAAGAAAAPAVKAAGKPRNRMLENILFMFLILILGSFLTFQIRVGINEQEQLLASKEKHTAYQLQLDDLKNKNKKLKEENTLLVAQKDQLTEDVLNEQGYSELAASLAETRELAGLTEVTGEGITITLSDSTITDSSNLNQSSLIHSQDVQYFVDTLKSAGARAIAINGERIVCTTSISCTGPTIRVNNSRYPVPFVITAVCDPNTTYDILQNDAQVIFRKSEGVGITVVKNNSISIPAFSDSTVIDSLSTELGVANPS